MPDSNETFSPEIDETQCGLILGCWDHEKTPTLIQDLEETVNLVERKCVKLFEELVFYKKCLEESTGSDFHSVVFGRNSKKSKNSSYFSGSDPDIAFRKTLLNFQKEQKGFEEKFQAKLRRINSELTEAAKKMGLRENVILLPPNEFPEVRFEKETNKKSCQDVRKNSKLNLAPSKIKSVPMLIQNSEEEFSKITKRELKLYQKLSRLSMKRKRKGRKVTRKTIKFLIKRKTPRHRRDFLEFKSESNRPKSRKISRRQKKRRAAPRKSFSSSLSDSFLENPLDKLNIPDTADKKSQWVCESLDNKCLPKRTASAFDPRSSASRSLNAGLNVQGPQPPPRPRNKPKGNSFWETKDFESDESANSAKADMGAAESVVNRADTDTDTAALLLSRSNKTSKWNSNFRRSILWSLDSKSDLFENEMVGLLKKEKSTSGHGKSEHLRKVRSRYTGRSPEGFVLGHKSTMSRYTSGQKSMFESKSSTAYLVGSKIMVSDCQRTDVFQFRTDDSLENASGDGVCVERCDKLSTGWTKAYDSFLRMYRKYASLKERLAGAGSFSDEELKSLESELDYSIEKYKDFLQFYSKFVHLNQHLKSLKTTCESKMIGPSSSFSSKCSGKSCTYKSTYSVTMKKALREVQALQDKIKLVNA